MHGLKHRLHCSQIARLLVLVLKSVLVSRKEGTGSSLELKPHEWCGLEQGAYPLNLTFLESTFTHWVMINEINNTYQFLAHCKTPNSKIYI